MTIQEAEANIGHEFKWLGSDEGITSRFDTIKKVRKGWIYGDFIAAPVEDCRLKQHQPEQLKQH